MCPILVGKAVTEISFILLSDWAKKRNDESLSIRNISFFVSAEVNIGKWSKRSVAIPDTALTWSKLVKGFPSSVLKVIVTRVGF